MGLSSLVLVALLGCSGAMTDNTSTDDTSTDDTSIDDTGSVADDTGISETGDSGDSGDAGVPDGFSAEGWAQTEALLDAFVAGNVSDEFQAAIDALEASTTEADLDYLYEVFTLGVEDPFPTPLQDPYTPLTAAQLEADPVILKVQLEAYRAAVAGGYVPDQRNLIDSFFAGLGLQDALDAPARFKESVNSLAEKAQTAGLQTARFALCVVGIAAAEAGMWLGGGRRDKPRQKTERFAMADPAKAYAKGARGVLPGRYESTSGSSAGFQVEVTIDPQSGSERVKVTGDLPAANVELTGVADCTTWGWSEADEYYTAENCSGLGTVTATTVDTNCTTAGVQVTCDIHHYTELYHNLTSGEIIKEERVNLTLADETCQCEEVLRIWSDQVGGLRTPGNPTTVYLTGTNWYGADGDETYNVDLKAAIEQ